MNMRGFSNKHFTEARRYEPPLAIAQRFAPVRIVSTNETIPGDLGKEQPIAMSWDMAKRSFGQGFRCLWNIERVLMTRAKLRARLAYHRIMQARFLPWVLAGLGMPGWIAFVVTEMVR